MEWGALRLTLGGAAPREILLRLPDSRVFEDVTARPVDLDGRPGAEAVMVVETDLARGARLSLYGPEGLLAAGPFIGQPHRWLAPVAAADLDGDGSIELAYVDRPHLARTLRIWRYRPGQVELEEVAQIGGLTNHRIGWDHIAGGLRDCGQGPEMVVADADWQHIVAARLSGGRIGTRVLGLYDAAAMAVALACR